MRTLNPLDTQQNLRRSLTKNCRPGSFYAMAFTRTMQVSVRHVRFPGISLGCGISDPCLKLLRFLGRLDENAIHARRQEASEKRQGTKSREVWHPTVQERLWGIRHVDCGADRGREALGAILGRWECEAGREQLEGGEKHGGSGGWERRSGKRCRCRRMTRRQGGLLYAMQL